MASHSTRGPVTTALHGVVGGVLGRPSATPLLGSHNFTVTDLGSRVKWPLPYYNLRACRQARVYFIADT